MTLEEKLQNLYRNKRRAKRRGDPHFYKIKEEIKALKEKIERSKNDV